MYALKAARRTREHLLPLRMESANNIDHATLPAQELVEPLAPLRLIERCQIVVAHRLGRVAMIDRFADNVDVTDDNDLATSLQQSAHPRFQDAHEAHLERQPLFVRQVWAVDVDEDEEAKINNSGAPFHVEVERFSFRDVDVKQRRVRRVTADVLLCWNGLSL